MRSKRWFGRLVGGACVAAAALVLLWPGRPDEFKPAAQELRRVGQLDALVGAARRKQALKTTVIDGLIAGRLTLAGAVARFEEIEAEFPELATESRAGLEASQPGRTYRERLAHSVVAHCTKRLEGQPERAGPVLARLDAELAAFIQSGE